MTEIASAVTVPAKPAVKPSRQQRQVLLGLEGMLQENLRLGAEHRAGQQGLAAGWGDPSPSGMDCSREFLPAAASQPLSRSQSCVGESGGGAGAGGEGAPPGPAPPMPRILARLASCVGVLHMRDPAILKLGGEATRSLAAAAMRTSTETFFSSQLALPAWDPRKLAAWHLTLGGGVASSHLQLLAAPLTIAYEEGTSIGPGLASSYAAITTLNLGRVSLVEVRLTSVSMSNMVYCC